MKPPMLPSEFSAWHTPAVFWSLFWSLFLTLSVLIFPLAASSQETPSPEESIADAARNAREHKSNSDSTKIFTNDDLVAPSSSTRSTGNSPTGQASSTATQAGAATPETSDCNNPDSERLKNELQATQDELDQLHRELSADPPVISDDDVDLTNFKPGASGLAFGSPPLLESQPQAPGRVREVFLEERVASLKESVRLACDPPKDAAIRKKLYDTEKNLKLLQQEFDLDQAAYYSKPDYTEDTAGKAKLDAEQQQIQSLQAEVQSLHEQLAASETEPSAP
jgi:hypothetical protein